MPKKGAAADAAKAERKARKQEVRRERVECARAQDPGQMKCALSLDALSPLSLASPSRSCPAPWPPSKR